MTDVMSSASTTAAASTSTSSSTSILSEKVSRALQVRTDTPAMKAALEALGHMPLLDSRSVRVAIEQDALVQAKLLQSHLADLMKEVQTLRWGVGDVATVARAVQTAVHMSVLTDETPNTTLLLGGAGGGGDKTNNPSASTAAATADPTTGTVATSTTGATSTATSTSTASSAANNANANNNTTALERELVLAAQLSDAFCARNLARQRHAAVCEFLDAFNLSPQDARLLDHYNFEDVEGNTAATNGMAFLKALDRVSGIRKALTRSFPTTSTTGTGNTSGGNTGIEPLGASSALRMMENLSQKQERAYERLYHWLQKYLASGDENALEEALIMVGHNHHHHQDDHKDGNIGSGGFIQRALQTLKQVPAFYSHLLELVAANRRTEVTKRFLLALTSGTPNGLPPLELKSHDSTAYVSDMLAFCFSSFSVEADVARGLLLHDNDTASTTATSEQDKNNRENSNMENSSSSLTGTASAAASQQVMEDELFDEKPITALDMLSISMSGLARPLKSRILQVISSLARQPSSSAGGVGGVDVADDASDDGGLDMMEEGFVQRHRITQLYEICGLTLFYASAVEKGVQKVMVQPQQQASQSADAASTATSSYSYSSHSELNPLHACLLECLDEATKGYEATSRVYVARMEHLAAVTGIDSEATLAQSLLQVLGEVRLHSPGFSANVPCPMQHCRDVLSMEWVTKILVESALASCQTLDDVVVLKQAVAIAKKVGMDIIAAEKLDEAIDDKESTLIKKVVEHELAKVLDLCGLGTMVLHLQQWKESEEADAATAETSTMASYPGLSQDDLEAGMKEFYASLFAPPLPSLETTIKDPLLRKTARSNISSRVCERYQEAYDAMMSAGCYDVSFLGHTPDQVSTLFSI